MNLIIKDPSFVYYIDSLNLEIKVRPYSFDDYFRLTESDDVPLTKKGRVKKILYDHIVSPPLEFEKFDEISDADLQDLGSKFLKKNSDSKLEISDGEDFADFFLRVINDEEKRVAESREKINAYLIKSNQELINDVRKTFEPLFKSSIGSLQFLSDLIPIMARSILPSLDVLDSVDNIIHQMSSINLKLIESIQNQFNSLVNWFDIHDGIFSPYRQYLQLFEEKYQIPEERAVEVLRKYHWLFSPSMPPSLLDKIVKIDERGGSNLHKKINHLFYEYFKENNRSNLRNMVNGWENISLFNGKRFKIIYDCLNVIMLCDSSVNNAANVVVPTLITLIEGIMCDYLEMHGLYWDLLDKPYVYGWIDPKTMDFLKDKNGKNLKPKDIIKDLKPKTMPSLLDELASELSFDILFQKAFRGESPEIKILFNRHKIMHGENIYYGRQDYMIKAFLILDFLAHIIDET